MATERVEIEGHIIDSLLLAKVLDVILASGADYRMTDVTIGRTSTDTSRAELELVAPDDDTLAALLQELQVHGANRVAVGDVELVAADADGVLPRGFYATTNLATHVRVRGRWLEVVDPEMDCALVVDHDERAPDEGGAEGGVGGGDRADDRAGAEAGGDGGVARTVPMHRVRRGDQVVVGTEGVRVEAPAKPRSGRGAEGGFEVSGERPTGLLVAEVADRLRRAHEAGGRVLVVCGPAVVHTGGGVDLAGLVRSGWVDVVVTGNAFAAYDIEAGVLGTWSRLPSTVFPQEGHAEGHANHLRVVNEVRRRGSLTAAVADGFVPAGVVYECVRAGVGLVVAGSVRDEAPLPGTHTDVLAAMDAVRAEVGGVVVALVLATRLHGAAATRVLPARVDTYCVDISRATVARLGERRQVRGIVTDVGLFLRLLREQLSP